MAFKLGTASLSNLYGVNDTLCKIVKRALELSEVDLSVVDGLRDIEEQRQNVLEGVSWSLESYHLPDENGESCAVDIYPWVNGKTDHGQEHYNKIAKAMFRASQEEGVRLEWGGFFIESRKDNPHWQLIKPE